MICPECGEWVNEATLNHKTQTLTCPECHYTGPVYVWRNETDWEDEYEQ